jgi:hypothetical protein
MALLYINGMECLKRRGKRGRAYGNADSMQEEEFMEMDEGIADLPDMRDHHRSFWALRVQHKATNMRQRCSG